MTTTEFTDSNGSSWRFDPGTQLWSRWDGSNWITAGKTPPPGYAVAAPLGSPFPQDHAAARAAAQAAKAHAKALRPWYKKKRYWALGIIAVIVIIIVATTAGGGGKSPTSADGTASSATTGGATTTTTAGNPGLGQPALDGDFAFTVHSVTCGITHMGTSTFGTTAPAGTQWCVAHMTVANDKSESKDYFAGNQKAIDTQGRQLSADTKVILLTSGPGSVLSTTLNPGVSITVQVPYRLPSTAHVKQLVLHDSAFSGGVTVDVG
ncbi:MAG TPA: DUF4352 domain-containing protein [Acidimicrobiales bacterium]|nr:DUF4352 domain-containing protein [Acidimicrobiales bacterium]